MYVVMLTREIMKVRPLPVTPGIVHVRKQLPPLCRPLEEAAAALLRLDVAPLMKRA